MDAFQKFLEDKLGPAMSKFGSNRYLLAVRDGVIAALPLIMSGRSFSSSPTRRCPRAGGSTSSSRLTPPRYCFPTA